MLSDLSSLTYLIDNPRARVASVGVKERTLEEEVAAHHLLFVTCSETNGADEGACVEEEVVSTIDHSPSREAPFDPPGLSQQEHGGVISPHCTFVFRPDVEYALLLNPVDELLEGSRIGLMSAGCRDNLPYDLLQSIKEDAVSTDHNHHSGTESLASCTSTQSAALALWSFSDMDPNVLMSISLLLDPNSEVSACDSHCVGSGHDS